MLFFLCVFASIATFATRKIMGGELPDGTNKMLLIVQVLSIVVLVIYVLTSIIGLFAGR